MTGDRLRSLLAPALITTLAACAGNAGATGPATAPPEPGPGATSIAPATPAPSDSPTPDVLPDPGFDAGQHVYLTESGPRPATLVAKVDQEIRWINLTEGPVSVTFISGSVASDPIPAGGSFGYTSSTPVAIAYETDAGGKGAVQVEVQLAPGEKPYLDTPRDVEP